MTISSARAEASLWIVRLHGPQRSPALEEGFQQWLAANAENRLEFERVNEVWDSMPNLANSGIPRIARWRAPVFTKSLARAAIVLLSAGLLLAGGWRLLHSVTPHYDTSIGEQRTVMLDDGTRVSLNSDSRLDIEYSEHARNVRLESGEAYFEVARDPRRPFTVSAGSQQVKALGTAFVVRYEPTRVAVALIEGKVSVGAGSSEATTLLPGERLIVAANEAAKRDKPRMEVVTAWRRGEVILDKTRLADAVSEMNRYNKTALVIEDLDLAELRVSGVYKTGDSESFARAAGRMLDLDIAVRGKKIFLRRKPS